MKRILPLLCIALLTLALAACNQEASVKIGVVDEAAAFKENKIANDAMAYLQKEGKPLQAKAEAAYKAMQKDQNEKTVAAYKLAMGELQNTMNGEQQRIVALVDAKFNEVLDQYRKDHGLTLILSKQSVLSAGETVDITQDVVKAMNGITLDFTKPAAAPAPKAPEAKQGDTPAAPAQAEAPAPAKTDDNAKAETKTDDKQ